jgi:hypothetical protein
MKTYIAYVQGVSTRSVDDLVQAMGMSGISKSQVSRLCGEIDEKMKAFLARPVEGDWPYLWMAALVMQIRRRDAAEQFVKRRLELIASLGSTLRLPRPVSGMRPIFTYLERSLWPPRSPPISRAGTSASESAAA